MSMFGGSKTPPVPKVPDPPALPLEPTGDATAQAAQKRKGFMSTILAGELSPKSSGKTLLG